MYVLNQQWISHKIKLNFNFLKSENNVRINVDNWKPIVDLLSQVELFSL